MAECAWHCGDPGVQYDTTINRWHTCPNSRPDQRQSNPCSEYMFLDDTACNLASINLMKFRQRRRHVRRRAVPGGLPHVLHRPGNPGRSRQLSDASESPRTAIASGRWAWATRTWAACSWPAGCRTTRDEARGAVRRDHGAAARRGQPDQRRAGRGGRPVRRLREEPRADAPRDADASRRGRGDRRRPARRICKTRPAQLWDEVLAAGRQHGFRNAQATVLAPTGTISFMMDCDTTGIEPDIALVKYKQLAGGGMLKIVNQTVPLALQDAGLRSSRRSSRSWPTSTSTTRSKARRLEGRAPAGVRLCVPAAQRHALDRLAGPRPDDGRRPAVPLGRDLEDGQHAARHHAGRHRQRVPRRLAAGPQGPGHLPRRLEGKPAAFDQAPKATRPRPSSCAAPRRERLPDTRQVDHPQVQRRRPRRLHHRRPVSPTAGRASCSSRWPRKAARSAA